MTHPLFDIQNTEEVGGRRRASRWLGIKLGLASLIVSLVPFMALVVLWVMIADNEGLIEGAAAMLVLNLLLAGFIGPGIAILLGAFALRLNRPLGKVFAVIGILLAVLTIGYFVVGQFANEGYL